jgi:hypothetical protein
MVGLIDEAILLLIDFIRLGWEEGADAVELCLGQFCIVGPDSIYS